MLFQLYIAVVMAVAALSEPVADPEIILWRDTLTVAAKERFDRSLDEKISYILKTGKHVRATYVPPSVRPDIYLVSRSYIKKHARQICPKEFSNAELPQCAERIFGWIDDKRKIYVLRAEDVSVSEPQFFAGISPELWVEMEVFHETVHYVQATARPDLQPTTLDCAMTEKWETEAHALTHYWLHSLQSIDAERINARLRGGLAHFSCADPVVETSSSSSIPTTD